MNKQKVKKLRKLARKEVRNQVGEGMEALSHIIRKRPSWIPKRIWIWAYIPLFEKKYRGLIYKYMD